MNLANIMERLEILEETIRELRGLPGLVVRVEAQIAQLDHRMSEGISALRAEMAGLEEGSRRHATALHEGAVEQVRTLGADLRAEMAGLEEGSRRHATALHEDAVEQVRTLGADLRAEMAGLNEESRRHALVLHEDLVSRIKTIGEAQPKRRRRGDL